MVIPRSPDAAPAGVASVGNPGGIVLNQVAPLSLDTESPVQAKPERCSMRKSLAKIATIRGSARLIAMLGSFWASFWASKPGVAGEVEGRLLLSAVTFTSVPPVGPGLTCPAMAT